MLHNNCIIEVDNQSEFNIALFLDDTPIPQSKQGNFLLGDALSEAPYANSHTVNLKIGENCFRLFTIWYQEKLSDLDIDIENRIIDLSRYFIGDKDSEFIVTLKNEQKDKKGRLYRFNTGWTVYPKGCLHNNTPFGGWIKG